MLEQNFKITHKVEEKSKNDNLIVRLETEENPKLAKDLVDYRHEAVQVVFKDVKSEKILHSGDFKVSKVHQKILKNGNKEVVLLQSEYKKADERIFVDMRFLSVTVEIELQQKGIEFEEVEDGIHKDAE